MLHPIKAQAPVPRDLAVRMIPTIHRIARQLAQHLPRHIRVDDLVGAGCQGLVSALARFDPARSEGFESYAELRIRGAMLDELRACDPLSRDQRAHANRIAGATRALHARLGRAPAADEVAAELGISLDTYWERLSAASSGLVGSLDGDDERGAVAQIPDTGAELADEHLSRKQLKQAINRAIAALPERLQRILELHYGEGLTLREIGDMMDVSESRVCQLQSEAVRRIRELCEEHLGDHAAPARSIAPTARRTPAQAAAIAA